ncbi:hypothetical protein [Paenibacillus sp. TH7-28]
MFCRYNAAFFGDPEFGGYRRRTEKNARRRAFEKAQGHRRAFFRDQPKNRCLTAGNWNNQLPEQPTASLPNSGILCSYYPEPGMFIPISGTFCPYFSMKGPERGHFLVIRENSDINVFYFSQMDG